MTFGDHVRYLIGLVGFAVDLIRDLPNFSIDVDDMSDWDVDDPLFVDGDLT